MTVGEIVQIIDYLAYLIDSYIFSEDSMTPGRCFIIGCDSLEGQLVNS